MDPSDARRFLEDLKIGIEDLAPWKLEGHPHEYSYGRTVIEEGKKYELMVVTWLPDDFSMIHNHGDASWGVVQIFGGLEHNSYSCKNRHLTLLGNSKVQEGQILGISPQLIHQMGNTTDQVIVSLHLYWNNDPQGAITANTFLYDVVNEQILTVDGGAFYALKEEWVLKADPILTSSPEILEQEKSRLAHRQRLITS
ncbi:MAG: cysteine dioxygenase family protein [Flavobacteriales bacterium]|nr:cysteine dioxygenase family protein [Flavobacteriales bacterium]